MDRNLKLVFHAQHAPTGRHILKLLVDLIGGGELAAAMPRFKVELVRCESQHEALSRLLEYARESAPPAVVLLSDSLVESVTDVTATDSWTPTYWAKDVADAIGPQGVTISLMAKPRRVADIDRTLVRTATREQLLATLRLAADKLTYISRPEKRLIPASLDVRLIRRQHELLDYFRLRHRIYKIMGYLRDEIENAPSQLEIDSCDAIALHCGAFERLRDGRENLIGTARVVIASSTAPQKHANLLALYKDWTGRLAAADPILNNAVANRVLELELPIFHSQNLSGILRKSVSSNEVYGELSRVIVAEEYRGGGLSKLLVEYALAEAAKAGVGHLFLECLELHADLYAKFGFCRVAGAQGTVIGVNKTMIAMELTPLVTGAQPPRAAVAVVEGGGHA